MPKTFLKNKIYLQNLTKYLLVLLVIVFISFLFPDNSKFKYYYDRGQTWQYEDLVAPFDFGIIKSEEEITAEKSSIKENFSPYYEIDLDIAKNSKRQFLESFDQQVELAIAEKQFNDVRRNRAKYRRFGTSLIENYYDRGIIALHPEHQGKGKDFVINIVSGNSNIKKTIEAIPTLEQVENDLMDSLYNSRLNEAEFLIPILDKIFVPNLSYNEALSEKFFNAKLEGIALSRGKIKKGDLIVSHQGYISEEVFQRLSSFQAHYEKSISDNKSWLGIFTGYFLLTSLIVSLFLMYLRINEKVVFNKISNLLFMLLWLLIFSYLVYFVDSLDSLNAYLVPFCIAPIVISHFFNARLALFTHIVIILIASFLSSLGYEFTFLHILAGIVIILLDIDLRHWNEFFRAIAFIMICYFISYFALSMTHEGSLESIDRSVFGMLFINSFLCLLAYPLIPLLEKLFGFTSSISLVELSDMNHPLLKELSIKAPGTLQHSLQVANLGEAAATSIRANSLLVKVAALYHDIGKLKNARFFIENQGSENPHDQLSPEESAGIILEHIPEGVKLAKKHKLPNIIIDFIKTHHGTTRVEYFYRKHCEARLLENTEDSNFRYPGPRPRSKEEAILMMADSLEAASKALKKPTGHDIDCLVDKIIEGKIAHGQLEHAMLSFRELEICKKEFKKLLRSINHGRIEYPE